MSLSPHFPQGEQVAGQYPFDSTVPSQSQVSALAGPLPATLGGHQPKYHEYHHQPSPSQLERHTCYTPVIVESAKGPQVKLTASSQQSSSSDPTTSSPLLGRSTPNAPMLMKSMSFPPGGNSPTFGVTASNSPGQQARREIKFKYHMSLLPAFLPKPAESKVYVALHYCSPVRNLIGTIYHRRENPG